jgi:hypothetical protein
MPASALKWTIMVKLLSMHDFDCAIRAQVLPASQTSP